jgi:hypothetical protein
MLEIFDADDVSYLFGNNVEQDIKDFQLKKMRSFRKNAYAVFMQRNLENLATYITHKNTPSTIDSLRLEATLRMPYKNTRVAVGLDKNNDLRILGTIIATQLTPSNYFVSLNIPTAPLTGDAILFSISSDLRLNDYKEATLDDPVGNFVVFQNRTFLAATDYSVIQNTALKVSELELSKLSLASQAKISTAILDDQNSDDALQAIADLYDGAPYVRAGKYFDTTNIVQLNNAQFFDNYKKLDDAIQQDISQMFALLGKNVNQIRKESGVAAEELEEASTESEINKKAYLDVRNNAWRLVNLMEFNEKRKEYPVYASS